MKNEYSGQAIERGELNGFTETSVVAYQPDLWGAALKTLAMLSIVIAVLILVLFLMRRFLYLRTGSGHGELIKVLSSYHMTPKERIALIDVAGEKVLIGITAENITRLAKIKDPKALARIENSKDHLTGGPSPFAKSLLSSLRSKRTASDK